MTTRLLLAPGCYLLALALIVCFGSLQSQNTEGLVSALGLIGILVVLYLTAAVRLPTYRWSFRSADTLQPGMWVSVNTEKKGLTRVTQILCIFEHHGRAHPIMVGLHNGRQLQLRRDEKVQVFKLRDPFSIIRRPRPNIQARFKVLRSPVAATTRFLHANRNSTISDICSDLSTHGHDRKIILDAIDATRRLGITSRRTHGKIGLTAAGEVWHYEQSRRHGVEVFHRAKEKEPVNIVNSGLMQFGNNNNAHYARSSGDGSAAQASSSTTPIDRDIDILRELLTVLARPAVRKEIHEDALPVLDEHVQTLSDAVNHRTPCNEGTRRAIKTILAIAGQLVIGAAGNGLYEALKQIVA
ncbi:hypothetical protein [Amycolatopsis sp. WGS_07]|uniref:hypothetical protein n=1 Tax=Amycolatopsis sp. WGS_07 TaxID=3076764 RepID=UPI0038739A90